MSIFKVNKTEDIENSGSSLEVAEDADKKDSKDKNGVKMKI